MAESVGLLTKLLKSLECPVCLMVYDNEHRQPKALRCQHTICALCVYQLDNGFVVKCPTCREGSTLGEVRSNYSLSNMLDDLCAECKSKGGEVHCNHCRKHLCQSCVDGHLPTIHAEVTSGLDLLKGDIDVMSSTARDTSVVKAERGKAATVLLKIRDTCKAYHEMIDGCQIELEKKVCEFKENNIDSTISWKDSLNADLINAAKFVEKTETRLSLASMSKYTLDEMVRFMDECSRVRETLNASKESRPQNLDYSFQETRDMTQLDFSDVGIIKSSVSPGASSDVSELRTRVPDYKTATVKCVAGGKGAGMDNLDCPIGIAVTVDGYILVADHLNNRVKVYDQNLNSCSTFGAEGTGVGLFRKPVGLAAALDGHIYVSDIDNDRIQVLRMAGPNIIHAEILNVTGLKNPQGLATDISGNLYICDRDNYRIQVVKRDGTHVQTIGSKGTDQAHFQGMPVYVALTKDQVIVSQCNPARVLLFDTSGRYVDTYPKNVVTSRMRPRGMAVDRVGNIVIADSRGHLVIIDKYGNFVCTIGSKGGAGRLGRLTGIAVCGDGSIVVCDYGNHRIRMFKIGH